MEKSAFTASDAKAILRLSAESVKQILFSLKRKGWIKRIARGLYEISLKETAEQDITVIASQLVWPSYLSLQSALNYYALTEAAPLTLFFVTTKRSQKRSILGVECCFRSVSADRFFGYEKCDGALMAEKEKALVDSIYFMDHVPFGEVEKAFAFLEKDAFDIDKLIDYALRMRSKALLKRLGYFLEKSALLGNKRASLLKKIGKGYSLLDPSGPKTGSYDKAWMLIINRGEL